MLSSSATSLASSLRDISVIYFPLSKVHRTMSLPPESGTLLDLYIDERLEANDPDLAAKLTERKEFAELSASRRERLIPGEYLPQQVLIGRVMNYLDRLLMIWEPGSGKTCGATNVSETFRVLERRYPGQSPVARTVILCSGKELAMEFKRQLVCSCNMGDFLYDEDGKTLIRKRMDQRINEWYDITSWEVFTASHLNSILLGEERLERRARRREAKEGPPMSRREIGMLEYREQLERRFKNTLFVVDEAHHLAITQNIDVTTLPDFKEARKDFTIYKFLWQIFHWVTGVKVILMTATPMFDRPTQIVPLMNLILEEKRQLDLRTVERALDEDNLDPLIPYFQGRVSYVAAPSGDAIPNYITNPDFVEPEEYTVALEELGISKDPLYWLEATETQKEQYALNATDDESLERESDSLSTGARNILHALYPPGYNKDNFHTITARELEGSIDELAPKYSAMLRFIRESPGKCYLFFPFVTGPWIEYFTVLLEKLLGYRAFNPQSVPRRGLAYCASDAKEGRRGLSIGKEPRYTMVTGKTQGRDRIQEVFNHPDNLRGEYIKVLIGSPTVREGYNFMDVSLVIIASPHWNRSALEQAKRRAFRAGSFQYLKTAIKEGEMKETKNLYLDANGILNVPVVIMGVHVEGVGGIDYSMYLRSLSKDIGIHKVLRTMKENAIDCYIHKERNTGGEDYSADCDYAECEYLCNGRQDLVPGSKIQVYDRKYMDPLLEKKKATITATLRNDGIYRLPSGDRYSEYATAELETERMVIINQLGIPRLVQQVGSYVTLVPIEQKGEDRARISKEYVSAQRNMNLQDFLRSVAEKKVATVPELTLEEMMKDINASVIIFEKAFLAGVEEKKLDYNQELALEVFSPYYYILPKPTPIAARRTARESKSPISGLESKEAILKGLDALYSRYNVDYDRQVVVHFINVISPEGGKYGLIQHYFNPRPNQLRILDASEEKLVWREPTADEVTYYNNAIQYLNSSRILGFLDRTPFGIILPNESLRIRKRDPAEKKDGRSKSRGVVCRTTPFRQLKEFLIQILLDERVAEGVELLPEEAEEMREILINNYQLDAGFVDSLDDNLLDGAKEILDSYPGINQKTVCAVIEEILREQDRIWSPDAPLPEWLYEYIIQEE